jgi:hypothetical protein
MFPTIEVTNCRNILIGRIRGRRSESFSEMKKFNHEGHEDHEGRGNTGGLTHFLPNLHLRALRVLRGSKLLKTPASFAPGGVGLASA